jgi:hypothetical protein
LPGGINLINSQTKNQCGNFSKSDGLPFKNSGKSYFGAQKACTLVCEHYVLV